MIEVVRFAVLYGMALLLTGILGALVLELIVVLGPAPAVEGMTLVAPRER